MADILQGCSTEDDLANLAQSISQEATLIRNSLLTSISVISVTKATTALAETNAKLDQLILPNKNDTVSKQVGLLPTTPSVTDSEERLEPFGLILVRKIIYAVGTDNNIELFRKLFFAVGSDVTRFLEAVHSENDYVAIQTRLLVKKLPQYYNNQVKTDWSISEARVYFDNEAIEQVYRAGDGFSYVIVPQFLSVNKSISQTALELNVPEEEIVTQIFWLNEIKTTSVNINNLSLLGLTGTEKTSILTNTAEKDINPTGLEETRTKADQAAATAISQIELLNSRFAQSDNETKEVFRKEILNSIKAQRTYLLSIERQVRFQPILLSRPQDIDDFLKKNTTDDLVYLFSQRRSVTSINFQIEQKDLNKLISKALNVPASSNTISSALSNRNLITVDPDVDATNQTWVLNQCATNNLSKVGDLHWLDLSISYQCLGSMRVRPTETVVSTQPVVGYPSFDSPSSIIVQNANLTLSLDIPNIFDQIIALADPISVNVSIAIRTLISLLKQLQSNVDAIIGPLLAQVKQTVAGIESFLSRHASYFATASIDSSILKCALGLDLRPSLPILDDISNLVEGLQVVLKDLIAVIAQIMEEFLAKYLCLISTILNDLLKSVTSVLPSICKTDTFKLPADLDAALKSLRDSFQIQSLSYLNFSRNLVKLQASITSLPLKLDTFRQDLACNQTPLNSRFTTAFRKNINADLGVTPDGFNASISGIKENPLTTILPVPGGLLPPRG